MVEYTTLMTLTSLISLPIILMIARALDRGNERIEELEKENDKLRGFK